MLQEDYFTFYPEMNYFACVCVLTVPSPYASHWIKHNGAILIMNFKLNLYIPEFWLYRRSSSNASKKDAHLVFWENGSNWPFWSPTLLYKLKVGDHSGLLLSIYRAKNFKCKLCRKALTPLHSLGNPTQFPYIGMMERAKEAN